MELFFELQLLFLISTEINDILVWFISVLDTLFQYAFIIKVSQLFRSAVLLF